MSIMIGSNKRSGHWDTMVNILEGLFPKGQCKERGAAMVLVSYIEMMLLGIKFDENDKPAKDK